MDLLEHPGQLFLYRLGRKNNRPNLGSIYRSSAGVNGAGRFLGSTQSICTSGSCKQRRILDSNLSVNPFSEGKRDRAVVHKKALVFKELRRHYETLRLRWQFKLIYIKTLPKISAVFPLPKRNQTKTPTTKHHYRGFQTPKYSNIRLHSESTTNFS